MAKNYGNGGWGGFSGNWEEDKKKTHSAGESKQQAAQSGNGWGGFTGDWENDKNVTVKQRSLQDVLRENKEKDDARRRAAALEGVQLVGEATKNRVKDMLGDAFGSLTGLKSGYQRAGEALQTEAERYDRDAKLYQQMADSAGRANSSALYVQALQGMTDRENRYGKALDKALGLAGQAVQMDKERQEQLRETNKGAYYGEKLDVHQIEGQLQIIEKELEEARRKNVDILQGMDERKTGSPDSGFASQSELFPSAGNGYIREEQNNAAQAEQRIKELEQQKAIYSAALRYRKDMDEADRFGTIISAVKADPEFRQKAEKGKQSYESGRAASQATYLNLAPYEHYEKFAYEDDLNGTNSSFLTDDQKDVYYALYADNPQEAQEYANWAKEQGLRTHLNELRKDAGEHWYSRLGNWFVSAGQGLIAGLDPFSEWGQRQSREAEARMQGISEGLYEEGLFGSGFGAGEFDIPILGRKSMGDLAQLGSSMLQSGALALAAKLTGGLGGSAGLVKTVEAMGTILMGSSASASDYRECLEAGYSDSEAILHAVCTGINEALFEYVSLDNLVDQDVARGFLRNLFTQGGIEMSEELCTTIANKIADYAVSSAYGRDSAAVRRAKELMAEGMGFDEAYEKARQEWVVELINDGFGGFLSGGTMSAVSTGITKAHESYTMTRTEAAGRKAAGTMSQDQIQREIQRVESNSEKARANGLNDMAKMLERYAEGLRQGAKDASSVKTEDVRDAMQDGAKEAEASAEQVGESFSTQDQTAGETEAREISQEREQGREQGRREAANLDDAAIENMVQVITQAAEETRAEGRTQEAERSLGYAEGLQEALAARQTGENGVEVPGVDWDDGRWDGLLNDRETGSGGDGSFDSGFASAQNDNIGRQGAVPAAFDNRQAAVENGGQLARATETEGLNYGAGTEGAADRGQRDAGLGAGEQAGGLGEGTGGSVTGSTSSQERNELKNYVKALGDQRASARDLGIRNGTKNATNVLVNVEALTGSLRERYTALREKAGQEGVRLDFVVGRMETRLGKKVSTSSGIYQVDADGTPHIFLQVDSRQFTPEQLYEHEMFHTIVARNKGLWQDILRHLKETHTSEEIRAMVEAYASAYDGCYGYEDGAEDLYLEEIMADVYAEMQRGGGQESAARELAGETAQRFAGDIENARQNRAGIDRTNGPGQRFSAEVIKNLTEENERELLDNVVNGEYFDGTYIPLRRNTPGILIQEVNRHTQGKTQVQDLPIASEVGHLRQTMDSDEGSYNQNQRPHNMSTDDMISIIKGMDDPSYIVLQQNGRYVEVIRFKSEKGGRICWAVLQFDKGIYKSLLNGYSEGTYNLLVTSFEPDDFESYLQNEGNIIIYDKAKDGARSDSGRSWPSYSNATPFAESTLSQPEQNVNDKYEGVDWAGSREAQSQNEGSNRWSDLRSRVSELDESQRRSLVAEAAELNNATWREEGLGIKPYSGDLADVEAIVKYVDDAVDAVKAEPGSSEYDPSFDLEATPRGEGTDIRLSAADEEDVGGVDWLDGSELEETGDADSSTALRSAQNDKTEAPAKTDVPSSVTAEAVTPSPQGEGFEAQAREKKVELAEKLGIDGLKSRIKTAEERLRVWKTLEQSGLAAQDAGSRAELRARINDIRETVDVFQAELAKKQATKKAEKADAAKKAERKQQRAAEKKALAKEAEMKDNRPRQARKEFREDALNLFSVQAGKRQTLGNIINSFADKLIAQGSVSEADRAELFRQLYEAGVEVVQADEYYRNIRETVDSARIYVPDSVRAEFGDDWNDFRQKAWANGVWMTNDSNDRGADSWNAELAEMFPGSFDAGELDARAMLENIVDLAEEVKAEFVSLPEMMRRNQAETGVTVDQQMDELERKVDHLIDTFARMADLEIRTKKQGTMQLVKERQKNREMAARQMQRKRENDTRNEVMKQLQQLNKMRKRSAPEIQRQIDDIIGNLDTMARSISPEGMENLQALARKYEEAKAAAGGDWASGGNFLGNPYVEARLARLGQIQLDSLEISDVIELGRTISALVKTVTEEKRLLTDAREREISDAAKAANREIASSAGSKGGKLREFLGNEHLSPVRQIQRLGGWVRDGVMEQLSRALEDGGTRRMEYQRQATRIFDKFLEDKANQKWLRKAQGKDAEWIKVTVPAGITDENGNLKVQNVTFELTPMMRVGLLMHSRNTDNLRHIETGGIVIPEKEAYRKGNLADADAGGTRVKLRPEVVRAIVRDCTAQERAFASLLEQYYDGFSKEKINEVSMLIDGFERAGGDHYYGIKVSRKFLATQAEQIKMDRSLESIGSIVNERIHAGNPIILEDASTALKDHIDLISKYYGFTAPIRDFEAVMNYTFHTGAEEGGVTNAYAGSVKETLQDKWKAGAQKYVDDLLADLQQSSGINETAAAFLAKLRGNLAGASLMFNPAVAISQTASLPGAIQVVGFDGMVAGLKPEKVDMNLVEKYTPILWYRNQGNSTQELGDYMARQGLEGKLPWMFNWIQKMDSWTIRRLWAASEYRVSKDTDLAPGSKAQIDAGEDAYYQEVARVFQRAVYDTQPNYSEMQRPAILRSKSDLTKMLTMYKTVPLQYYNMMYEAVGRLKADKARFEADGSAANKANLAKSRSFAAKTFVGVLGANVVYVAMKAAVKGLLAGKDDRFKDEEGEFDWGKTLSGLGKDLIETYAGSLIFGSELLSGMEKLYNAATTGKYSMYGGLEISALGAVEDTLGGLYNLAKELYKQDLTGGLGAIKDLAKQLAMDTGIPANNIGTYLLGTAKWFAPEWIDRYENLFDEFERADLKGEHGRDLRAAIRVLMDNRTDGLNDETIDELMRLWETGQNAVIPSAIPSKVSVDGEDVEIKGADKGAFRERWSQVISASLEQLLAADAYQAADDAGKAKLISKLYEYARQQAAAAVTDKGLDNWVTFGQACEAAGIPLEQYLAVASVDKSKLKDMDGEALDNAIQARMEFRVGELNEKTLDELGRLYAAGGTGAIPADVPTGVSVGGEEQKLSPEERVAWLQAWQRTAGENLEALMASKAYAKADDAGKLKLISALYDMARASASSEVVAGYEPDKWITIGMEAKERGVALDEYAAFHVGLSGLKTAEKMDLLKSQKWSESQKEYLWTKLMATDAQLAKYENLKNAGLKWSDAMERLGIGEASTSSAGLTDKQQVQYDKYFSDISGPATKRLLSNTAYKRADKATQAAYLDRLNDYAARSAKAKVLSGYDKGKWVECGERLTSAGVKLDEYVVFYEGTSDGNNRAKYGALAETGWTDSQKLIAMEYISSSTYSAAKVGASYQINVDLYLNGLAKADADQSGNISQAEAEDYLDGLAIGREEKAYLWQMLSIQSKWKNNPYSAGYGEEIWYDLHPEG